MGGGQLAITIDPAKGQRYQGIVPLGDSSLGDSLEVYFAQSEQLPTRFWLACDGQRAAGMLLQQLPPQQTTDAQQRDRQWQHACTLAATIEPGELLELGAPELLHRLYHEEPVRLFESQPVTFGCSCSRERSLAALAALGADELESLLEEQPSISMDCEFCLQHYRFQRRDLADILGQSDQKTVH